MLSTAISTLYAAVAQPALAPAVKPDAADPTALDTVGAVIAMATLGAAAACLVGMIGWMVYKALTQPQSLQTSWPEAQEHQFAPYADVETRIHGKSWTFAFVSAAVALVLALILYFGVTPKKDTGAEDSTADSKQTAPAAVEKP